MDVRAKLIWTEKYGTNSIPEYPKIQSSWDAIMCGSTTEKLLSETNSLQDRARLLATASEHTGDWLNAVPISSLGLKMNNTQVRIACSLRLGSPMCQPHKCICGTEVDQTGVHGLSCRKSAGRLSRHSYANDIIKRGLSSANIPSTLEPLGVSRSDGKRPDGMSVFPWSKGRLLVWDFTCVDTLAPSYLLSAAEEQAKVASDAEGRKASKYETLSEMYHFIPIAVETLGSWGPTGLRFIKELGRRIQNATGEPRSTAFLFQTLSMTVQRGNAASILGTAESTTNLDQIYYL